MSEEFFMREFYKIKGSFYARTSIKAVRHTKEKIGKDNISRDWIVVVDTQCVGGDPKYADIWCTKKELGILLEDLEQEVAA